MGLSFLLDWKRVAWNWLALYLIEFIKIINIFMGRGFPVRCLRSGRLMVTPSRRVLNGGVGLPGTRDARW